MKQPLITITDATFRVGDAQLLPYTSWTLHDDEHWAIIGPNGAGKSTFVRALWGGTVLSRGRISYPMITQEHTGVVDTVQESGHQEPPADQSVRAHFGYVSFELHLAMVARERTLAEAREFAGTRDEITRVRDVISNAAGTVSALEAERRRDAAVDALGISGLLDRDIATLSTGESRKVLIARALAKAPRVLVLDEPFDGLDAAARTMLDEILDAVVATGVRIILVVHRVEQIPPFITHVMLLKEGRIVAQGRKDEVLHGRNLTDIFDTGVGVRSLGGRFELKYRMRKGVPLELAVPGLEEAPDEILSMQDITIHFANEPAVRELDWTVTKGEHWAILGPNGSGKSTILHLITGDHPQAYANRIRIFGRERGSGESVWDIKKRIGTVSYDIQLRFRPDDTGREVIVSGLYDALGLYRRATKEDFEKADHIAILLGVTDLLEERYDRLSNGQKRMLLLARAMVKPPPLLILDEPCHGLDIANRRRVLEVIERICNTPVTVLMTTHHHDEIVPSIGKVLSFDVRTGRFIPQSLAGF